MRIVVITDAHANYPALKAVLKDAAGLGYDLIFHTGDAIGIGPQPAECLDLLLNTPNIRFVMGNHDAYFVHGLSAPLPAYMSKGEEEHQRWTHAQLTTRLKNILAAWPMFLNYEFENKKVSFSHYGLTESGKKLVNLVPNPDGPGLDKVFALHNDSLIFYGHEHSPSDVQTTRRYVNPGSLGCAPSPLARYCVVDFEHGQYTIEHHDINYDDRGLYEAFKQRRVPERHFIYRTFFGGRFPDD